MSDPESADSASRRAWGLESPGLGLALGGTHDAGQLARQRSWVDRAESLGLHSVWLPEMHFAAGVCPAPLVELAGLAARTRRLRLGTTSLLLPLHPPEEIAQELATLDRLSGGRLLIGLGRGFDRRMLEAFGVDPARKRDRFDDALDRILAVWSRPDARHAPHQKPHPPLAVAAFGPKGIAQAARRGLPYLASPVESLDQIAENQARHRALLEEPAGRPLSLVMRTVFVSDSQSELDAARTSLAAEAERRGRSLPASIDRALSSPLEERVVLGRPEAVARRLRADRERLGLDLLIVRPQLAGIETSSLERSLACLAREIWPEVVGASTAA